MDIKNCRIFFIFIKINRFQHPAVQLNAIVFICEIVWHNCSNIFINSIVERRNLFFHAVFVAVQFLQFVVTHTDKVQHAVAAFVEAVNRTIFHWQDFTFASQCKCIDNRIESFCGNKGYAVFTAVQRFATTKTAVAAYAGAPGNIVRTPRCHFAIFQQINQRVFVHTVFCIVSCLHKDFVHTCKACIADGPFVFCNQFFVFTFFDVIQPQTVFAGCKTFYKI